MRFSSREDAGRQLGQRLAAHDAPLDIALGLPRGGVVVAAEVARQLKLPLDVLVVRKIGHPTHREFAVGALAEAGVVRLDQQALVDYNVNQWRLQEVVAEETARLHRYETAFHPAGPPELAGKNVLLVDDGLATGATAEAAVASARERHAARVTVAAPVASVAAMDRLRAVADDVFALIVDPEFMAVGQFYQHFPQTTDDQVLALLPAHA